MDGWIKKFFYIGFENLSFSSPQVRTSSYDSYHAHYSSTRSLGGRHALGRGHWGGRSRTSQASSHRVTSVVLAITSVFLLSQLFAAAQVLIHLLGYEQLCGHPCAVFTQVNNSIFFSSFYKISVGYFLLPQVVIRC